MASVVDYLPLSGKPWELEPSVGATLLNRVAPMLPERYPDVAAVAPRLLVSAYASADDSVLTGILRVLDKGIEVDSLSVAQQNPYVQFAVEGSSAASVSSMTALSFVVRPITSAEYQDLPRIAERLKASIVDALGDQGGNSAIGTRYVEVWPFTNFSNGNLFQSTLFHEFRFGVDASGGQFTNTKRLSQVLARFSRQLGEKQVPIAYFYYPHAWKTGRQGPLAVLGELADGMLWLRVAVGFPQGIVEPLEIQMIAANIAEDLDVALCLYNPASDAELMGGRFELIAIPSLMRSSLPAAPDAPVPGGQVAELDSSSLSDSPAITAVFVEGRARAGLIADMMGSTDLENPHIYGGSMSVLQGHTVAAFLVDSEIGTAFEAKLKRVVSDGGPSRTGSGEVYPTRRSEVTYDTIWISWRCPDRPDVLVSLMDRLLRMTDTLADDLEGYGEIRASRAFVRVEYLVSRALAEGNASAGKIKLSFRSDVVSRLLAKSDILTAQLRSAVMASRDDWNPPVDEWRRHPISVSPGEPAEDPWALLGFYDSNLPAPRQFDRSSPLGDDVVEG